MQCKPCVVNRPPNSSANSRYFFVSPARFALCKRCCTPVVVKKSNFQQYSGLTKQNRSKKAENLPLTSE